MDQSIYKARRVEAFGRVNAGIRDLAQLAGVQLTEPRNIPKNTAPDLKHDLIVLEALRAIAAGAGIKPTEPHSIPKTATQEVRHLIVLEAIADTLEQVKSRMEERETEGKAHG